MMKLIWHADKLWEQDWLRYLFDDLIEAEIIDLDLIHFGDHSIHVISENRTPLAACEQYFRACREHCEHIVLVHVSDEYFSGGYGMYKYFDRVIRWNHTYLADSRGILTIPLGVPVGTGQSTRLADQRQYAWSFVGQIKASRIAAMAAFDGFEPQCMIRTDPIFDPRGKKISKADFDCILAESAFSPCPMGNATIDTCRVYESLDLGAIPLVELRLGFNYYANLLGPNPIPAFKNWHDARQFAERTYADQKVLLELQTTVLSWWKSHKLKVRAQVREAVTGPSRAVDLESYASMIRNRYRLVHEALRMGELLRHQTPGSLGRRITRPSGPLKRIVHDLRARSSAP